LKKKIHINSILLMNSSKKRPTQNLASGFRCNII
jgi:hypothetical protein